MPRTSVPGFTGGSAGRYAKKHDPFLYFLDVADSRARRDLVVPFTRLAARPLERTGCPTSPSWFPNLCDDMHDCSVATGDAWLKAHVVPLLHSPELRGGVVFVVFDEGTSDTGGGGRVEALALGPTVRGGSRFTKATNHYGLLRTIEDAWGLPRLGDSRTRHADRGHLESRRPAPRARNPSGHAGFDRTRARGARPDSRPRRPRRGARRAGRRWSWDGIANGSAPSLGRAAA